MPTFTTRRALPLILAAMFLAPAAVGTACDMNVREAGFINNDESPYRPRPCGAWLLCLKSGPEEKAWVERTEKLCAETLEGLNLVPSVLATEAMKPEQVKDLQDHGVDLGKLPLTVIVRMNEIDLQILSTLPGRADEAALKGLFSSPKQTELKKLLADLGNYCAIIFTPGKDPKASQAALDTIKAAVAEHIKARPTQKVPILQVDRADGAEAFLLAELGVKPDSAEPVALVAFGKGCLLAGGQGRLEGQNLSAENFQAIFAYLNHNASDCTPDAVFERDRDTIDLLMHWEPALSDKFAGEIAKTGADARVGTIFGGESPAPEAHTGATTRTAPPPKPLPTRPAGVFLPVLAVAAGAAGLLVAAVIVGWLLLRKRPEV